MNSPGATSMVISTWFKIKDNNSFLPENPISALSGLGLGAGAWPGGAGTPPYSSVPINGYFGGGGGDLVTFGDPFSVYYFANPMPICEWGNQSNTVNFINSGDNGTSTSNSGLYITSDKHIVFFSGGTFYNEVIARSTNAFPDQQFAPFYMRDTYYSTQLLIANASEISADWNHLFVTADVSTPDSWPRPPNEMVLSGSVPSTFPGAGTLSLIQNSRLSIVCNNVTHTAGFNGQVGTDINGSGIDAGTFVPSEPGDAHYLTYSPLPRTYQGAVGGPRIYNLAGDTNPATELFGGDGFGIPCLQENAAAYYNYPKLVFAYTQVWFNKYIDPSAGNLAKFFTQKTVNGQPRLVPPTDIQAAQKAFGPSDIWCYRDKNKKIQYQTNQGTAGPLTVVSTSPADYTPGPGQ